MKFLNTVQVDSRNILYVDSSTQRVGIGNNAPTAPLHVSNTVIGTAYTSSQINIEWSSAFKLGISHRGYFFGEGNNDFRFNRGGSTQLNIHGTAGAANFGYVGIGTTDASELLHLSSTGPARLLIEADTDNATETDNAQIILKQDGGLVAGRLGFKTNSNSLEMWNESNEALIFGTNDTQRLYISSSGTSTFSGTVIANGNVGIGTTNPQAKLHVANSGECKIDIEDTGGQKYRIFARDGDNVFAFYDATNPKTWFRYYGNSNTNSTKLALLEGGGNVGIGTDSPDSNLEVAGSTGSNTVLHVRNDSTGSTRLKFSNSTDTNANGFQIINNALNGSVNLLNYKATTLALWTNSSQKLTILSNGDVGIGTTSPGKLLEVSGGANEACLRLRDTTSNFWDIQNTTFGKLDFSRGGVFRMGLNTGGGLSLNNTSATKIGGGDWGNYSDERVKKDVSNYTKGLNEILAINPVTYKYNGKANIESEKQFVGIIAQEIKEVLPSTVEVTPTKLNDEDEFDTDLLIFDGSELKFTLINAVKELKAEIEELKKQINK